jgi:hypothetical protein
MKRLADIFLVGGFVGWLLAIVTRLAQRDFVFPSIQLPAQTYLDFGWTCFFAAGVLTLRSLRDGGKPPAAGGEKPE